MMTHPRTAPACPEGRLVLHPAPAEARHTAEPRADDFDWVYEEPPVDALPGGGSGPDGLTGLGDLLLDLVGSTARLGVMLREAEEEEFRAYLPRLLTLLAIVDALPRQATERLRIGFRPPEKPTKAKGKARKARRS